MFQLIVAVVSILLIAVLSLAAIYWGGSAHSEASLKARYSANVNAATQIEAAQHLYYQDHVSSPPGVDMEQLENLKSEGYLKAVPGGDWRVGDGLWKPTLEQTVEHCTAMNKVAGYDIEDITLESAGYAGCPPCNGVEGSTEAALAADFRLWPGCQFS